MACYVYGHRQAEEHLWPRNTKHGIHRHGKGPLCLRCGLPIGTFDYEEADDLHVVETGHHLGAWAHELQCGPEGHVTTHESEEA